MEVVTMETIESIKIQHLWQIHNTGWKDHYHRYAFAGAMKNGKVENRLPLWYDINIYGRYWGMLECFQGSCLATCIIPNHSLFVSVVLIILFGIVTITSYIYQIGHVA